MHLSQELVEHIVDFVQNDQTTLSSVRLVSQTWNLSASRHLFHSLDLLIFDPPKSEYGGRSCHSVKVKSRGVDKFKSILSILESSDVIPYCVREVTLGRTPRFALTDDKQNVYAELLSSILTRLGHVSSIFIREINWANLSPSFISCILNLCERSTIKHIGLWNCQMPSASSIIDFLRVSKTLRSLYLSYVVLPKLNADEILHSSSSAQPKHIKPFTSSLHSLAIEWGTDIFALPNFLGALPHCFDFTNLCDLRLSSVHDGVGITEFLKKAGHSLEFLDLRLTPRTQVQNQASTEQLDLSHCPHLKRLHISGLHWMPHICPADYLGNLFSKISGPSFFPLERLQLVLMILKVKTHYPIPGGSNGNILEPNYHYHHHHSDTINSHPPPPVVELVYTKWTLLDDILSSSSTFPALRELQIEAKTIRKGDVDPSKLFDMFPKLRKQGVQVTCM